MRIILIFIIFLNIHQTKATEFYIGTSNSEGIYHSQINLSNGNLSPFKLVASLKRPSFLSIDYENRRIYSTNLTNFNQSGEIVSFEIKKGGYLEELNRVSSHGINPCHIQISPNKKILFAVNYGTPSRLKNLDYRAGSIASYKILSDGKLSTAVSTYAHKGAGTHPTRQKEPHAHSVFAHPFDSFVYVPDLGADTVFNYKYNDQNGELIPHSKNKINGYSMGPRHMKWDREGKFFYLINELTPSLSVFEYKGNGWIKEVANIDALPDDIDKNELTAAEIRIHPFKPIIYTTIRDKTIAGRDCISIFSMNGYETKRLKTISSEVSFPRNFNIDPTGKWLVIAGQKSRDIAIFSIDADGIPHFSKLKYSFPGEPICIEFFH